MAPSNCGFGGNVRHARFVHPATGQRALFEELLLAIEEPLGGVELLLIGLDVGLRLHHRLGNGREFGAVDVERGLIHLGLGVVDGGFEIAALEGGNDLAFLHVVTAIDVELHHRLADVGHHAGLAEREQHAIAGHNAANGLLGHAGDLDGRGRFHLGLFFLGAAGGETRRRPALRTTIDSSLPKTPP